MNGFNPGAAFLLELAWPNLFEPANARELDHWTYRCKGCGTLVKRCDREGHYRRHKRDEYARRDSEIKAARLRGLEKARQTRNERRAA